LRVLDKEAHLTLGGAAQLLDDIGRAGDGVVLHGKERVERVDHNLMEQLSFGLDVAVNACRSDAQRVGNIAHAGGPIAMFGKQRRGRSAHVRASVVHPRPPAARWPRLRS